MKQASKKIFKNGSRTYYISSLFFPTELKDKVFTLYAYVRTVDNFVDTIPQQSTEFYRFVEETHEAFKGKKTDNPIITDFVALSKQYFEKSWVDAFLTSMEKDLSVRTYERWDDVKDYIYGSADVIGLMMARLMRLSENAYPAAEALGRSMQLINFIRDIDEDLRLNRIYIPQEDLQKFRITSEQLFSRSVENNAFSNLIRFEIERFREIQQSAEEGFKFIPRRLRIPVKTASDMYVWTADQIYNEPIIIFRKKVKPSKEKIVYQAIKNFV